ncbi:cytochrome P450 [Pluteus cervinus]|uniref:Cytochrome P450 n=1 Tax=Pluteus cervinus TaxID=181527 RepID=A0ACD3A6Z6_9AGAR|nr:cytochrome P450 [Pluteus cervinus]
MAARSGGWILGEEGLKRPSPSLHSASELRGMLAGFYAAMILHPDIQRKVQEAIDAAVGKNRLPEVDDLEDIPYLHAVVKEALRWQPAFPLALPHAACEDDIYRGYAIPKGSAVVGNTWVFKQRFRAILHDESMFGPDTHLFKPERFLTKDRKELDPSVPHPEMAFGYGRRICPGRFIAYSTILIASASLLHCFTISKGRDNNGNEVEPALDYTTGVISFPKPFECEFTIRSAILKQLVEEITEPVQ